MRVRTSLPEMITSTGLNTEEFVTLLKEVSGLFQKEEQDPEAKIFLEIMISVSSYESFIEMMMQHVIDSKE